MRAKPNDDFELMCVLIGLMIAPTALATLRHSLQSVADRIRHRRTTQWTS